MKREDFFSTVRSAALAGRQYRPHVLRDLPLEPGYGERSPDLVARLAKEIDAVGGKSHVVPDMAAAQAVVMELVQQRNARSVQLWQHPVLDELEIKPCLAARGIEALDYMDLSRLAAAELRPTLLAFDLGITSADFAIAETGSLVMLAGAGHERTASLLPPVHVAIVKRSQILADLFDLFDELQSTGQPVMPSNLVLITGPSKTGDIELTLTTGVHGPGEWHVVIVG